MSTIINRSEINISVDKKDGRIIATSPITVKNQIQEIKTIDDIPGFNNADREDGAVLMYNANTGLYDSKTFLGSTPLRAGNLYARTVWANNSIGNTGQVLHSNGSSIYWANAVNVAFIATLTSNNATFAYGKREADLSVNFSQFTANANFAYVANAASFANNTTYAFGKTEGSLVVQYASLAGTANLANLATLSNNSTFAYGKREADLSVNFSQFTANANFAYTANIASYANILTNTNITVSNASYASDAALLNGQPGTYYSNAGNLSGTLPSTVLPNTSVAVGSYGGASQIPVITVDQYGRINAISTSAVAGVSTYSYNAANNTFSIGTGDGSVFNATLSAVTDLSVTGNLTVSGTTTTINTQNITVNDAIITLNSGQITPFNDIGLLLQRYASANTTDYNVAIAWDEDSQQLKFGKAPQDGSTNEVSFSSEWVRFDNAGNAYVLLSIEAGDNLKAANSLIINNVSITETSYPGTANAALYFNGSIDEGEF